MLKHKIVIITLVILEAITSFLCYIFFDNVKLSIKICLIILSFLWIILLYWYIRRLEE